MKNITLLALAALYPCSAALAADEPQPKQARPNIVLVITDDQRYDSLTTVQGEQGQAARFPWSETPSMDRLAREGARFRNAFVINSLCSPSRASILTGVYSHLNGIVNNHTNFPEDSSTYVKLLREAGYRTGYFGKWHMGTQSGQRPGFDYSASFVGQGHYFDEPFEINGQSTPTTGWVDDVTTDFALQFIRENKDRPFAITVGFKSPHGPHIPPPRLASYYAGKQSKPVPNLGAPLIFDPSHATWDTNRMSKRENLDYDRTIHGADEDFGRILDELDKLGLARNTLVIFTSDNGLFRGEHSLGDKRAAYEESIRVPMLLRYPAECRPGQVIDQPVLNIDIPPTILDYASVKIPDSMQGRSWKPLLEGKTADWRTSFFYTYYLERDYPRMPTMTAVRTDSAKLIVYTAHPEWTELFDLKADPYEIKNLINDPGSADLRRQMEVLYDKESKAVGFCIPDFVDKPPANWKLKAEGQPKKNKGNKGNQGNQGNQPQEPGEQPSE